MALAYQNGCDEKGYENNARSCPQGPRQPKRLQHRLRREAHDESPDSRPRSTYATRQAPFRGEPVGNQSIGWYPGEADADSNKHALREIEVPDVLCERRSHESRREDDDA